MVCAREEISAGLSSTKRIRLLLAIGDEEWQAAVDKERCRKCKAVKEGMTMTSLTNRKVVSAIDGNCIDGGIYVYGS